MTILNLKALLGHSSDTPALLAVDKDGYVFVQHENGDQHRLLGGSALTAPINPTDNGKVAVAASGDLSYTATPTVTSLTAQQSALGVTLSHGVTLQNTTAATAGDTNQYSPGLRLAGSTWDGTGLAAVATEIAVQARGADFGGGVVGTVLALMGKVGAGSFSDILLLIAAGAAGTILNFAKDSSVTLGISGATGVQDGKFITIAGQEPSNGDGGGVILTAKDGVGTDKDGGYVQVNLGTRTGTGIPGYFAINTDFKVTDDNKVAFFGVTPFARPSAYTVTNPITRRSFDTTTVTLQQLAEVMGTVIGDQQGYGLFA